MKKALSAADEFLLKMQNKSFSDFYKNQSPEIKDFIKKCPWDYYRVKKGAPYLISHPGAFVELIAYSENGDVRVAFREKHFTDKTRTAIKQKCDESGADFKSIVKKDHSMHLSPEWLEPITGDEYFKDLP